MILFPYLRSRCIYKWILTDATFSLKKNSTEKLKELEISLILEIYIKRLFLNQHIYKHNKWPNKLQCLKTAKQGD